MKALRVHFFRCIFGLLALCEVAMANGPHATNKVQYHLALGEGEKISIDYAKELKRGRYCVLIGFSNEINPKDVKIGSTDPSMDKAWQFHRKNKSKNVYGINSFKDLIAAIKDCPKENNIILQTHGFGEDSGGFHISQDDFIGIDDPRFEKLAQALAGRKRVHFWACSMASSTKDQEEVSDNFVDKLVNRAYQIAKKKEIDPVKPSYYAYTNVMFNSKEGFKAGVPGWEEFDGTGSEVVFTPDTPKSRRALVNPVLTQSNKKPEEPKNRFFFETFQVK